MDITGRLVGFVAAGPRINFQFAHTDIPHLKLMLNQQLCAATGSTRRADSSDVARSEVAASVPILSQEETNREL